MTGPGATREKTASAEKEPAEATQGLLRQLPRLPGTALPKSTGLLLVLVAILVIELLRLAGVMVPAPGAILLLAVAYATWLDGVRTGMLAGLVLIVYEVADYVWRGTVLIDTSDPVLRASGFAVITALMVALIGAFRRRLDALLRKERKLLEEAESKHSELEAALGRVQRAQEAIRFQARLLDAVGQAVIATDQRGRIIYWNGPATTLFGVSAASARGRPITDVMPDPPGGRLGTLDRMRRGVGGSGEVEVNRVDGSAVTVMYHDAPIRDDDEGRPTGLVRIIADMTRRKQVERAQRLLADAASALAASMDYEATVRSVARLCVPSFADCCLIDVVEENGSARRLEAAHIDRARESDLRNAAAPYEVGTGSLNPVAEVIHTGLPRFYPKITDATLDEARDASHAAWLRSFGFRSAIVAPLRAGGNTLGAISFYRLGLSPEYSEPDLLLAEELASRAATAIHQARLYEAAMIANRVKSDFLAVMSHELRTPLTTITGYTDLMLANVPEPLPEKHHRYVDRIRLAATHLLSLIEQILVYARLEAGRERMHPERIAVSELLDDTGALIEPVATEHGIRFRVEPVPADTYLESDKTKVRQILLNLLANAVKFTDEGEVLLSAKRERGNIEFTVRDTGIGISARDLDHIFDPFWQVDQSSTRRAGGAGIGLAVTRRLARMLGGDVTVESRPGGGTRFTVRLPIGWTGADVEAPATVSHEVDRLEARG